MKIIYGDILQVGLGGVICHQVNCRKVAGAGLAKQIRDRVSGWYGHFRTINGNLGDVDYFHVGDTVIASLYAQDEYGTDKQYTDYMALKACLQRVASYHNAHHDKIVYFPWGIGAGLGGGDWEVISKMIDDTIINPVIVRLSE